MAHASVHAQKMGQNTNTSWAPSTTAAGNPSAAHVHRRPRLRSQRAIPQPPNAATSAPVASSFNTCSNPAMTHLPTLRSDQAGGIGERKDRDAILRAGLCDRARDGTRHVAGRKVVRVRYVPRSRERTTDPSKPRPGLHRQLHLDRQHPAIRRDQREVGLWSAGRPPGSSPIRTDASSSPRSLSWARISRSLSTSQPGKPA
jgi:hypothetical protein